VTPPLLLRTTYYMELALWREALESPEFGFTFDSNGEFLSDDVATTVLDETMNAYPVALPSHIGVSGGGRGRLAHRQKCPRHHVSSVFAIGEAKDKPSEELAATTTAYLDTVQLLQHKHARRCAAIANVPKLDGDEGALVSSTESCQVVASE